jgi:hypothetical protein
MAANSKVGFLADTHSRKPDGSDLPDGVLKAFAKVDLIVHLGDIGRHGILDRLGEVAPVMVPAGDGKGYVPRGAAAEPVKVIEVGGRAVGLTFNIAQPDKKIAMGDDALTFAAPVSDLVQRRFKQPVDVIAFGGTHREHQERTDGILFFNPGSPTLPMGDAGTVAVLEVKAGKPAVKIVTLR